jgi:hypothetical protein
LTDEEFDVIKASIVERIIMCARVQPCYWQKDSLILQWFPKLSEEDQTALTLAADQCMAQFAETIALQKKYKTELGWKIKALCLRPASPA